MSEWYADGLRFECTLCGNCCTGTPGYVWLSPRDEEAITRFLDLDPDRFRARYTRLAPKGVSLVEKPGSHGDCVFLTDDKRCAIQPVKPRQCLIYPFWPQLLASREKWIEGTLRCPGSSLNTSLPESSSGPLFRPEEIDAIADRETPRELLCKLMKQERD